MGRHRKPDDDRRTYPARALLTESERDGLDRAAREHGLTMSAVIRAALRAFPVSQPLPGVARGDVGQSVTRGDR